MGFVVPRYRPLSIPAATAYAQLQDAVLASELQRDVSHLNGSFGSKQIRHSKHWYFSYRDPDSRIRQLYVGPDTEPVRRVVEQARERDPRAELRPLARAAAQLGCATAVRKHVLVVERLNEYGFFRAGGVLVGTHAFLAYANMLGLRWSASDQTADVDFAHAGRNISVLLPGDVDVAVHDALTTLEEGFLPLVKYEGGAGASYTSKHDLSFQVDFVTPRVSRSDEPFSVGNLKVALQPLRFMEFSLEDVQSAVLLEQTGRCTSITVPHPARYAIHKLLVAGERGPSHRTKSLKDIAQACALLEYFRDHDPDAAKSAWADARARGRGWSARAAEGKRQVNAIDASLAKLLR